MDAMKTAMAVGVLLSAAVLAGPALGQASSVQGDISSKGAVTVEDTRIRAVTPPDTSEGEAEELRLAGHCDKAVPILRTYVTRDDDESIARFNLGLCLLELAKAQRDAGPAADMRKEGAGWILRAADGGLAKAQAEAVVICLDGTGVAADPVEAAKWSILYHRNSTRIAIGLRDIAPQVSDRLDAALTDAARGQAQARADDWAHAAQASEQ